jgi:hypothetical protein
MPFTSKRQQRAAFGGHIPGISKKKARQWAHETPSIKSLPERVPGEKGKRTLRSKKAEVELPKLPKPAVRAAVRNLRRSRAGQELLKELNRQLDSDTTQKIVDKYKEVKSDLRVPHFGKIAQMLGMAGSAGSMGALPGASGPASAFDAPQSAQSARGAGDFTPAKPKKPGHPLRRQATNPRLRLLDAMNKGVA